MKLIPLRVGRSASERTNDEMLHISIGAALGLGPDARLVLDGACKVIRANKAASLVAQALADDASEAAKAVREWAADDFLGTLSLALQDAAGERRFTLHAMPVVRADGTRAAIVIGREPDLSGHLMQALAASRQLYKDLVSCAGALAWETDTQGRFVYASGSEMLGYAVLDLMGEEPARRFDLDFETASAVFSAREAVVEAELWPRRANGERACLLISASPVFDAEGQWRGTRGMARDVSRDRAQAEALAKARDTMARMALTDELTNLLNRRAFDDQVAVRIAHAQRAGRDGALLVIDLDHFKAVNDTLGHAAGDAVLKALGELLDRLLRIGDLAARMGGDEFAVWLEDTDREGAERLAGRLLEHAGLLREAAGAKNCPVSMSIGIAPAIAGQPFLETLKLRADAALYEAKNAGRDRYAVTREK